MSMRAWIKRPQKPTETATVQRILVGITAAEIVPIHQDEAVLKLSLANSSVVETNSFKIPTIKAIKVVEKLGGIFVFEIELTDGRKIETNALQRLPSFSPTAIVLPLLRDTLFATTLGVQPAMREKIVISWNRDYSPANSGAVTVDGTVCAVEKPGRITAHVRLRLVVKKPTKEEDVWLLRLRIVRKRDSRPMAEAKIHLPFTQDPSPLDAGLYRFENLPFTVKEAFEVVLECLADEKLYMGISNPTTLELMWWPTNTNA